jgi:hypothetical protein
MIIKVRGLKVWLIVLGVLAFGIFILILLFNLLLFLLPLIALLIIVSYLFKMLNKVKKGKNKDYIDIEFREKK